MTAAAIDRIVDLRRGALANLRAIDFRAPGRDYWTDEAAVHDRFVAVWAGLDDAAWRLPGAAPSDAGGPDWSLLDHVGHVVDWWELAIGYIGAVVAGGAWPADEDYYATGDFNTFNERRRAQFTDLPPVELRARGAAAHEAVVAVARQLPIETIRSDAAWGWVHQVLHGHAVEHLTVLEPWADSLRTRQIGNDPFGPDQQPGRATLGADQARFWSTAAPILADFDRLMAETPEDGWTAAPPHATGAGVARAAATRPEAGAAATGLEAGAATDEAWSLADHVAHLGGWFDEGAAALETHRPGGVWADLPPEGLDSFNARQVRAARGTPPAELRRRYAAGAARLRAAIEAMTDDEWLDPEGFSWAYEDLHGHVRAHHAMIGPWTARLGWPSPGESPEPATNDER